MTDETITRGADPAYREALIKKLGDSDPVQVLSELLERLEVALEGLTGEQLREREAPGKWSVQQVVRHLADVELVQSLRIRRILTEDSPALNAMDPDRWVSSLWASDAPLREALEQLGALRSANLRLVADLSDAELDREGIHPERGAESLLTVLRIIAAHDGVHLSQIGRIRAAIGAPHEGEEAG